MDNKSNIILIIISIVISFGIIEDSILRDPDQRNALSFPYAKIPAILATIWRKIYVEDNGVGELLYTLAV